MAWLSVGTTNDDLIQKMIENGVLHDGPVLEAFRATDRGDFVNNVEDKIQAYSDRPFKKGIVHMSAPHMYATVLKALDLKPGKSFLNIGSGSGYLSCMAAFLLGEEGVSHGVEINEATCIFSRERAKLWHAKLKAENETASSGPVRSVISADGISFVNASCFDIDILSVVNTFKYDRIYVGAGCPEARKDFFLSMLADNGIMVVPINEKSQMLSIRKFCGRVYSVKPISNVHFAELLDIGVRPDEGDLLRELAVLEGGESCLGGDLAHSIGKVTAAPASSSFIIHPPPATQTSYSNTFFANPHSHSGASSPSWSVSASSVSSAAAASSPPGPNTNNVARVRLPALVWAPVRQRHLQFPPEFRRAVFTILLANNASQAGCPCSGQQTVQPTVQQTVQQLQRRQRVCRCGGVGTGFVGALPHQIWLQIFSFANREWFHMPRSELHALSMELAVERRQRRSAEERARRAEADRRAAERERDTYRMALVRLQQQTKGKVGQQLGAFWGSLEEEFEDGEEEEEEDEDEDGEEEVDEEDEMDGDNMEGDDEGQDHDHGEEEDEGESSTMSEENEETEEEGEEEWETESEIESDGGVESAAPAAPMQVVVMAEAADPLPFVSPDGDSASTASHTSVLSAHFQDAEQGDQQTMAMAMAVAAAEIDVAMPTLMEPDSSPLFQIAPPLLSTEVPTMPFQTAQQHQPAHLWLSSFTSSSSAAPFPAPIATTSLPGEPHLSVPAAASHTSLDSAQACSLGSEHTGTTTMESLCRLSSSSAAFSLPARRNSHFVARKGSGDGDGDGDGGGGDGLLALGSAASVSGERISDCTSATADLDLADMDQDQDQDLDNGGSSYYCEERSDDADLDNAL